jgi:hypothetical protein
MREDSFMMIRCYTLVAWIAGIVCLGCGHSNNPHFEKTTSVRGKITLTNGSPLRGGLVTLHPKDVTRGESRGTIDRDGNFTLGTYKVSDGAMPGQYTVTVEPIVYDQRGNMRRDKSLNIPLKYTRAESSDLMVEIQDEESQELSLRLR